jgi:replication initiation and membrane attachment protein
MNSNSFETEAKEILTMDFTIMIEKPYTQYERDVFNHLYLPLVGSLAEGIYSLSYSLVTQESLESLVISHQRFLSQLGNVTSDDFLAARKKLEAVGLFETYYKDGMAIYVVKNVLTYASFFKDELLTNALVATLGEEEVSILVSNHLLRRFDCQKFQNVTCSFDDVFSFETESHAPYEMMGTSCLGNGTFLKNTKFNYQYLSVLLDSLELVRKDILMSNDFLEKLSRYNFLYGLTIEELKDAVIESVRVDKTIDDERLLWAIKKIYDRKAQGKPVQIHTKINPNQEKMDKIDLYLESTSPNEIVKNKFGTALTSSEVQMFDSLIQDLGISVGVLNVAIVYVMEELNGQIPAYNYFAKVINTWKRENITSAKQAREKINGFAKEPPKRYTKEKKTKPTPSWYQDYKENRGKQENSTKTPDEKLEELKEFFHPLDKE